MRKAVLSLARENLAAASRTEGPSFDHRRPSVVQGSASATSCPGPCPAGARARSAASPAGWAGAASLSRPRLRRPPLRRRPRFGPFARLPVAGSVGTLATGVAVLWSFFINRSWTFGRGGRTTAQEVDGHAV
jgi:hypothetical protein